MLCVLALLTIIFVGRVAAENSSFTAKDFNLSGDIHYVFNNGLNYGAGYAIGDFNEILGLRASLVGKEIDVISKAGVGVDVKISKLLEKTFGFDWKLGAFNPTFGLATGTDFLKLVDGESLWDSLYVSLYVNIFRLEF